MITREDIVYRYQQGDSIKQLARATGICAGTIRRILITAGIPLRDCPHADHIMRLLDTHTPEEIAEAMGIRLKTVMGYMPYERGSYATDEKTINAQRIAACRKRKAEKEENCE